jgi:hypothetical protein
MAKRARGATSASFRVRRYGFFSRPREARELTTSGDATLQNKRVRSPRRGRRLDSSSATPRSLLHRTDVKHCVSRRTRSPSQSPPRASRTEPNRTEPNRTEPNRIETFETSSRRADSSASLARSIPRRAPLFPRMNASPYLFFNCPLTYSYHRAPSSFVSPPSSRFRVFARSRARPSVPSLAPPSAPSLCSCTRPGTPARLRRFDVASSVSRVRVRAALDRTRRGRRFHSFISLRPASTRLDAPR